jgi:hypothetical protein
MKRNDEGLALIAFDLGAGQLWFFMLHHEIGTPSRGGYPEKSRGEPPALLSG